MPVGLEYNRACIYIHTCTLKQWQHLVYTCSSVPVSRGWGADVCAGWQLYIALCTIAQCASKDSFPFLSASSHPALSLPRVGVGRLTTEVGKEGMSVKALR